jgi:hypothetical protein
MMGYSMNVPFDFEGVWQSKFSDALQEIVGENMRKEIMKGSQDLTDRSPNDEVVRWSQNAIEHLDQLVEENERIEIMTRCACHYSADELEPIRNEYQNNKDIDQAIAMLQSQFEAFLKNFLKLDNELIEEIVRKGWGSAGVRLDNRILATKIPKSGSLFEYMQEKDPKKKRALYCHCPRIRAILGSNETISSTYCYCGAGFYKDIWETILQEPVRVELLESVMTGGDVCQVAIHLPFKVEE